MHRLTLAIRSTLLATFQLYVLLCEQMYFEHSVCVSSSDTCFGADLCAGRCAMNATYPLPIAIYKFVIPADAQDTLAEQLRRRPAKPIGSPRVGSNPTGAARATIR